MKYALGKVIKMFEHNASHIDTCKRLSRMLAYI